LNIRSLKTWMLVAAIPLMTGSIFAQAEDASPPAHSGMGSAHMMHQSMSEASDKRISLGLEPQQKQHQLANMRSHLEAVQSIVGMLAENRFEEASTIAHTKLGLTPEMEAMCNMFENKDFKAMGLAFHQSGDALGDTLKTKNLKQSLQALHTTMNYCIQCHTTYRQ